FVGPIARADVQVDPHSPLRTTDTSAMNSSPTQVFRQLGPGAMEPGLDGPDGAADRLGDLVVGQPLLVIECEDQTILGPEPREAPFQFARQVIGIGQPGTMVDA